MSQKTYSEDRRVFICRNGGCEIEVCPSELMDPNDSFNQECGTCGLDLGFREMHPHELLDRMYAERRRYFDLLRRKFQPAKELFAERVERYLVGSDGICRACGTDTLHGPCPDSCSRIQLRALFEMDGDA